MQPTPELLLMCLGRKDPGRLAERLSRLSEAGWEDLFQQAGRHGLDPLLYRRLKTLVPAPAMPASIVERAQLAHLRQAASAMRLYQQFAEVVTALGRAGFPSIALKGAHLAQLAYPNPALRPMSDLDLLVRAADLAGAEAALLQLGYRSERDYDIGLACAKSQHLPPLTRPDAASLVELHWTLLAPRAPFAVDVDGLWQRARPARIAGVEVLTLSPEDLLLHLALHATFQDRLLGGLRPLVDVAVTLERYRDELDWGQFVARAREWGAARCAYLTVCLVGDLLGAPVPDEALSGLRPDDFNPQLVAWAGEQVMTDLGDLPPLSANLARFWGCGRLRDKLALFLSIVFPSGRRLAVLYPKLHDSPRAYLQLLRLRDLLWRHGPAARGLVRRDQDMLAWAERESVLFEWMTSA